MTRRALVALMWLALAALARPARAAPTAHAGLLNADPTPGSTVPASPSQIRLTFDEALAPGSAFVVYAAAFQAVPGITPMIEGAALRAALPAPLAPGNYTVQWKAVTADGGVTTGSYQFGVRPSTTAQTPLWIAGLALVALIVGGAVFRRRARQRAQA